MKKQVSLKKKIGAIAVATGMMLGGAVAVANSASAHTPGVSAECGWLHVNPTGYLTNDPSDPANPTPNSVTVTVNNNSVANANFSTSFLASYPFLPDQSNTYTVVVTAWDDPSSSQGFTKTFTDTVEGCVTPPSPVVMLGYSTSCGVITLTTNNNESVPATWYYGLKGSVDGTKVISAVQQGPGTKTTSYTFAEDQAGGSVDVAVTVYASTEQNLLPAAWPYGFVKIVPVSTNCVAPVTHEVLPPTVISPMCEAAGSVTGTTTDFYEWKLLPDSRTGVYTAVPKNDPQGNPYTLTGTLTFNPGPLDQLNCVQEINVTPPVYIAPTCYATGSITGLVTELYEWKLQSNGVYIATARVGPSHLNGTTRFGPAPLVQLTGTTCIVVRPPVVAVPPVAVVVVPPKTVKVPKVVTVKVPKIVTVKTHKVATVTPVKEKALAFTGAESIPLGIIGMIMLMLGGALTTVKCYIKKERNPSERV